MKEQRTDFHSDVQRLGLKKRLGTEGGIVSNGNVVGHQAAGENREAQVAQSHLAAQSVGEFRFQPGTKGVGVDKQRNKQNNQQQENDNGNDNADQRTLLHRTPLPMIGCCSSPLSGGFIMVDSGYIFGVAVDHNPAS